MFMYIHDKYRYRLIVVYCYPLLNLFPRYNYFGSQQLTEKFNSDMAQFRGILMLPCFSDEAWMPICSRALQRLTPKQYLKVAFGDPQQFSLIRDYWVTKGLSKYPSTGRFLTKLLLSTLKDNRNKQHTIMIVVTYKDSAIRHNSDLFYSSSDAVCLSVGI